MMSAVRDSERFQEVVRCAAAQLVALEVIGGASYVTTPLLYASGAYVVVRVERSGNDYFVSDFGAGYEEAQQMAGEAVYKRVARSVAESNGVKFDSFSFFELVVSDGQLPGAIAAIANSSQEAVNITAMKLSERTFRDDSEVLHQRLNSIFDPRHVAKDVHITGASNTEWHVASLVTINDQRVAFESVTKHPNSVVHAAAKFGDLARLDDAPGRVAVVASKKLLGTYLGVLSHNARVIEQGAQDTVYQRLVQNAA